MADQHKILKNPKEKAWKQQSLFHWWLSFQQQLISYPRTGSSYIPDDVYNSDIVEYTKHVTGMCSRARSSDSWKSSIPTLVPSGRISNRFVIYTIWPSSRDGYTLHSPDNSVWLFQLIDIEVQERWHFLSVKQSFYCLRTIGVIKGLPAPRSMSFTVAKLMPAISAKSIWEIPKVLRRSL